MDCVNHSGVGAVVYCQNCGKGLCPECLVAGTMRNAPRGQILCPQCIDAWQKLQPPFTGAQAGGPIYTGAQPGGPNPWVAGSLGVIPGVGAMYNGQFLKAFVHVIAFAVLVTMTSTVHGNLDIFLGLLIPAWILYQAFEAYHTAKAIRDGDPVPDPLGLNEVANWMNTGSRPRSPGQPGAGPYPAGPAQAGPAVPPVPGSYPPPYAGQSQPPYAPPYAQPAAGFVDPASPPVPPVYPEYWRPLFWRRKEPVGAIVLIGLGLLFLAGQFNLFSGYIVKFGWPLLLIALGVWLLVRRFEESQGGPK